MPTKKKVVKAAATAATSKTTKETGKKTRKSPVQASGIKAGKEPSITSKELASAMSIKERIALLAYSYWEERGRQGGSDIEDWCRAEKEILGQIGVTEQ